MVANPKGGGSRFPLYRGHVVDRCGVSHCADGAVTAVAVAKSATVGGKMRGAGVIQTRPDAFRYVADKQIRPAVVKYAGEVAKSVAAVKAIGVDASAEEELMQEIAMNLNLFHEKLKT